MKSSKWISFGIALAMIAVAAVFLQKLQGGQGLSAPGVLVTPAPLLNTNGQVLASHSVYLPPDLRDAKGYDMAITSDELNGLPSDTTFGRRRYVIQDVPVQASVVLMGRDRASIHQPQYCMVAQGWTIDRTDYPVVRMQWPHPYNLQVARLWMSRIGAHEAKQSGLYLYWFVSKDKMIPQESGRMLSMAWNALRNGELERWAYVSYFAPCQPGQEQTTFDLLEKVIQDSAPQFLLVAGAPDGRWTQVAAKQ